MAEVMLYKIIIIDDPYVQVMRTCGLEVLDISSKRTREVRAIDWPTTNRWPLTGSSPAL